MWLSHGVGFVSPFFVLSIPQHAPTAVASLRGPGQEGSFGCCWAGLAMIHSQQGILPTTDSQRRARASSMFEVGTLIPFGKLRGANDSHLPGSASRGRLFLSHLRPPLSSLNWLYRVARQRPTAATLAKHGRGGPAVAPQSST